MTVVLIWRSMNKIELSEDTLWTSDLEVLIFLAAANCLSPSWRSQADEAKQTKNKDEILRPLKPKPSANYNTRRNSVHKSFKHIMQIYIFLKLCFPGRLCQCHLLEPFNRAANPYVSHLSRYLLSAEGGRSNHRGGGGG